jgi:hypothetical protein
MAKGEVTAVSLAALQRAWDENLMTEKRAAGLFTEIIAHQVWRQVTPGTPGVNPAS